MQVPAVAAHIRGLDRVLGHLGMTDRPADPAAPPVNLRRFIWLRCANAGWWEPAVQTGQPVTEGQVLGTVGTLDGAEVLETITAPAAGVPMFVTSSPAVAADGLLLGLGAV